MNRTKQDKVFHLKNFINKKSLLIVFLTFFLVLLTGLIGVNLKNSLTKINQSSPVNQNQPQPGGFAWGSNNNGQLGIDFAPSQNPLPLPVKDIKIVAAGQNHSMALTNSGQVFNWGNDKFGQLGYPIKLLYTSTPTPLTRFTLAKQIAANSNHSLVLNSDGTVWAFGSNYTGQLGNNTNTNSTQPVQVGNLDHVRQIAAGYKFSLAIKDDNTLWAWGTSCDPSSKAAAKNLLQTFANNLSGLQNGYYDSGSTDLNNANQAEDCINEDIIGIRSKTPIQIKGIDLIQSVSGGYGHILVIKDDGTVWSFGCNKYGQLGQGNIVNSLANANPKQIPGLSAVASVSAGFRHSLALTKSGNVYAWGHNQFGELGQGNAGEFNPNPTKIEGLNDVIFIAAGFDYSLAVKKDGTLWGWGTNNFKQLSPNEEAIFTKPVQIKGIRNVDFVSAGGAHILSLTH